MGTLLKRIPFNAKLLLIAILPLLFLLFVALQLHKQRNEKIAIAEGTLYMLERSAAVSNIIDALQAERRSSFISSFSQQNNPDMPLLRSNTDAAISKLQAVEKGDFEALKVYTFLGRLEEIRRKVDARQMQPMQVMHFYTNSIIRINTLANLSISNVPFMAEANRDVIGQRILSEMATYLGVLRANVYYPLYTGQEMEESKEQVEGFNDIYRSYIAEFKSRASAGAVAAFDTIMNSEDVVRTNDYIAKMTAGKEHIPMDAENWWATSGRAVDKIRAYQRHMLESVITTVKTINKNEIEARNNNLIFLSMVIALVLAISMLITRSVADSLNSIKEAAQRIAKGGTDIELHVLSHDAIGALARSINEVDANNKVLAAAADAIGRGNFDIAVTPRSNEDLLGNAVVAMRTDLKTFNEQNARKIWIQTGLTKVNDAIRGDLDVPTICSRVMEVLVPYLQAQMGLAYVSQEGAVLRYAAGYAVADASRIRKVLELGETLVGQAARDKQLVSLTDVPDEFTHVATASGSQPSKHLLVLPLVHNDIVEGVLEFGALVAFSPNATALLEQVANNIAIALQAAKSKARLQELLEETQSQSEELQAQHNELENLNTELEAQAQKLQASEEELRVQQEELMQSNQELEERSRLLEERNQLIAERNLEIQKKAEELELSTRYKSEFLANMSHELRTPLNSILLLSRLLAENHDENLSDDQIEYATVIQSSGSGLLSLIDEILDLSKIEAGKMSLEFDQVNLRAVGEEMRRLFSPIAVEKGIALNISFNEPLPSSIESDKLRLEQILRNLLSNAIKFTQRGSVNLVFRLAEGSGKMEIAVKDTGIGIPEEKQQLIFEAFQQADGSTRRKFGGTGLGLSI
ncbi:MAG TPA: ATP-binding protein, partial [Flavipsychrobacter sp.]|nr:ATP-binding protein [Flavipsychrobacter sp.]